MRIWLFGMAWILPTMVFGVAGRIVGTVQGASDQPLAGVTVTLAFSSAERGATRETTTDANGDFEFSGVVAGTYLLTAELDGYETQGKPVEVGTNETARVTLSLRLVPYTETIFIEEELETEANAPEQPQELTVETMDVLPLPTDRFSEALPLVPGVVRGPEGRLNFNGARASQSTLLVNGSNVTDPLTGQFAIELPLRAIDSVEVHTLPYSAEYGQVTAAVTKVVTRGGSDEWDFNVAHPIPSLRFRDGTIMGIRSATPRVQLTGPIKRGKAWFSQGVDYRFVRSQVRDMDLPGEDEEILENFDSFTQLDLKLSDRHSLTTTFSYFPVETDNLGIDTLHPEEATPEFDSRGWNFAIGHRAVTSSRTLWETSAAVKTFDVTVRPENDDVSRVVFEGLRGNYFNELDRESTRFELNSACTHFIPTNKPHALKFGASLAYTTFAGTDRGLPIEVVGRDGTLVKTIEFQGDPAIGASAWLLAGFVQDKWRVSPQLGFDLGVRFDYEEITGTSHLSPRFAVAYSLTPEGRTVLRGGWGIFYDHVFLHAGSFERFQRRVETDLGPGGTPLGPPLVFSNRTDPEGLEVPRATVWNAELNHEVVSGLLVRVNYRERLGAQELVVNRLEETPDGPTLFLSSEGSSNAREFDITFKKSLARDDELYFSYVKSRTTGDLNNFGLIYQDLREPLLYDNEVSLQGFDVPHRFLLWGVVHLPKGIVVTPGIEWRSGFPYTVFDERHEVVGRRYRGGRFPTFFSADLRVMKSLTVLGRDIQVGFQIFNLMGRRNPRDVISNLASDEFGRMTNSIPFQASFRFQMDL